jgi:hypothetical protein
LNGEGSLEKKANVAKLEYCSGEGCTSLWKDRYTVMEIKVGEKEI